MTSRLDRRGALRWAAALAAGGAAASVGLDPAGGVVPPDAGPSGECAVKYAGYSAADHALPYARYFAGHTRPPQPAIGRALRRGALPTSAVPPRETLGAQMSRGHGYDAIETGYGQTATGEVWVAALTDMPGVRPHHWDWWFGWHSDASAKYKLWHPDAHRFAAIEHDLTATPGLTDRERYVGNVSYVDEYIGPHEQQLAIAFVEPAELGLSTASFRGTAICARVGSSIAPFDVGVLVHQVRRTRLGCEMRSRFYLNVPGVHEVDAHAATCALQRGVDNQALPPFDVGYGAELMRHCGQEMNHLAQFLPRLYAEFASA